MRASPPLTSRTEIAIGGSGAIGRVGLLCRTAQVIPSAAIPSRAVHHDQREAITDATAMKTHERSDRGRLFGTSLPGASNSRTRNAPAGSEMKFDRRAFWISRPRQGARPVPKPSWIVPAISARARLGTHLLKGCAK